MSGPNTTQTQVQTQTQIQELEAKKQKILEKITEELMRKWRWEGRDLENLVSAKLWGLKTYGDKSEGVLERIIELGYGPEDINVDRVWHNCWDPDALDIIIVLPNGAEKKLSVIPEKPVTTLSKQEYERVREEVKKVKESSKMEELEGKLARLEEELNWYKKEKERLEERLARLEEEISELNSMIEEFREFVIMKEMENEFVEWLAEKRNRQNLEQLKEEIRSQFFPNEYDDC